MTLTVYLAESLVSHVHGCALLCILHIDDPRIILYAVLVVRSLDAKKSRNMKDHVLFRLCRWSPLVQLAKKQEHVYRDRQLYYAVLGSNLHKNERLGE